MCRALEHVVLMIEKLNHIIVSLFLPFCALLVHLTHLLHYRPITFYGNHEPYKKSKVTLRSPWELFTDNIFQERTHTPIIILRSNKCQPIRKLPF